jgi:putative Holliday junction resolvase
MHERAMQERLEPWSRAAGGTLMAVEPKPTQGTVLGFDFGLRRTGVAVGDLGLGIAHPLCTVEGRSDEERFALIADLVVEWSPVLFVLGLPTQEDGSEHKLARPVRHFGRQLTRRFDVPVEFVDERLTSSEAQSNLRSAGIGGREQKRVLDQAAAQVILESFLNGRHASS